MAYKNHWNKQLYQAHHNREMADIASAVQPELDKRHKVIWTIFERARATMADEIGISQWERIFRIIPNLRTETLEYRRERIIARLRLSPPFTLAWLNYIWLPQLFPGGRFLASVDWRRLWLWVDVPVGSLSELREFRAELSLIIPVNLLLMVRRKLGPVDVDHVKPAMVTFATTKPVHQTKPHDRYVFKHALRPDITGVAAFSQRPVRHTTMPLPRPPRNNRFDISGFDNKRS